MEIKTETKMVEVTATTYVAVDGTEFNSEADCIEYEKGLTESELKAKADKLRLVDLDGTYPLDTNGQYINVNYSYTWYLVCDEDDYNILNALHNNEITKPKSYPETICVETDDYDHSSCYDYHLSTMWESTVAFWENFGFEVECRVKEN